MLREGPAKKPWNGRYLNDGGRPASKVIPGERTFPGKGDNGQDNILQCIRSGNVESIAKVPRHIGTSSHKESKLLLLSPEVIEGSHGTRLAGLGEENDVVGKVGPSSDISSSKLNKFVLQLAQNDTTLSVDTLEVGGGKKERGIGVSSSLGDGVESRAKFSKAKIVPDRLLRKKLGFFDDFTVSRVGLGGGLMLLWKEKSVVNVCSSSNYFIDAWISSPDILPRRFSGFYGKPDASQRGFSWELLRRLQFAYSGAWLCAGDFNEILNLEEKVGGGVKSQRAINDFRKAVDDCQICDLGFVGDPFTWCNNWPNDLIYERLDRGFGNIDWMDHFPNAKVEHLATICSDRRPLLFSFGNHLVADRCGRKKRVNRFHFEEAWSNDPGCGELVKSCWEVPATLGSADSLLDKLDWCGRKLQRWGRDKFKRLGKDIYEQYWKQRSRVSWLRDRDKNTKFFHRKASNRRFKNEILGIYDENGCWQTEVGLVKSVFRDYFTAIFSSSNPSLELIKKVIDSIPCRVSEEENCYLLRPFVVDDMKAALFDMNPTKAPRFDGLPTLFFPKILGGGR
ncbi:hypothetical protein UlMin_008549 [Ulmus minor]